MENRFAAAAAAVSISSLLNKLPSIYFYSQQISSINNRLSNLDCAIQSLM
ncbi:hypothetical protein NC653_029452 [Populus alba x Populus x berolinensis]|uniref:Uncharacterized protein n=1 Tax=Populus alba x Populus x berolinensis TaxID=444605 RepID=A0AAD6M4X8_9ROSI|nr:hypothetical protein NC653_029452 [Populus alba x Populus x berolinensis]